jgi:hypothetical protein
MTTTTVDTNTILLTAQRDRRYADVLARISNLPVQRTPEDTTWERMGIDAIDDD